MTVSTASKLDIEKFRKVRGLMTGGATEGERAAAKARAEAMAAKAGMTLKQALSILDSQAKPQPNVFDFGASFDDAMEKKYPGYKAKEAREKAEQRARDNARRAEVLAQYGSKAALFDRTRQEAALEAAIAHMATWGYWTNDDDGKEHRYAKTLDGREPDFWSLNEITPRIREAVTSAYPWPSTLDGVLREAKAWDRLRLDRGLFTDDGPYRGEWNHYAEVECRSRLLEEELERRPAASWEDVQARFDWKRWEFERQWIYPTKRDDPFMDRLEADISELKRTDPLKKGLSEGCSQSEHPSQTVHSGHGGEGEGASVQPIPLPRTNAQKRAAVLSMLDTYPDLSDREIARRVGVSPQTVNTWRKRQSSAVQA